MFDPNSDMTAAVIVSSDRAHTGTYEDLSGPAAKDWLESKGFNVVNKVVVPDEAGPLREMLDTYVSRGIQLIVISGGTGLGPRDITPQVLDAACDYAVPGFGEMLRQGSLKYSLNAYLSRCGGWVKGRTIVLALPGNPKAVVEQLSIMQDLLPHALKSMQGKCSDRRKTHDRP